MAWHMMFIGVALLGRYFLTLFERTVQGQGRRGLATVTCRVFVDMMISFAFCCMEGGV